MEVDEAAATPPSWEELTRLASSDRVEDRTFAVGALQLRFARGDAEERVRAAALFDVAERTAHAAHAATRARIARGELRGAELRALLEGAHPDVREHWTEELLGIAYPPLEARELPPDLVGYVPSGVAEILHALDATGLGPEHTIVDLGCGLGKVVLLASLLTGARARGVDLDERLVARAREAATALGASRCSFTWGDVREVDLSGGDVYFLYLPFSGRVLEQAMARLEAWSRSRRLRVCASGLDLSRVRWLEKRGEPSFWLDVYESA